MTKMTKEEAAAVYPGCPDAVHYHETDQHLSDIFPKARRLKMSPAHAVADMKRSAWLAICVALPTILDQGKEGYLDEYAKILHQLSHPDFLRYVTMKLQAH